ncbi:extracellular solute-binding protein [Allochromatium palmeri]|uniref:Extracellular solute-binding protein n=1 Tax=Allochromatium palmeri TaxID=231048 RepID=A0A6N8E9W9_9GAMM|nr:extracellular solute-binding protein [Allochromatium palmeri]MTW19629.1 extracellular solute-binding protein [Allochromatium palmeri]
MVSVRLGALMLLYYRKDLLDKHGFAPPETWADLERIARVILEREADPQLAGFVWQGSAYEGLTCNALEWIDSYRGGTIIDLYARPLAPRSSRPNSVWSRISRRCWRSH